MWRNDLICVNGLKMQKCNCLLYCKNRIERQKWRTGWKWVEALKIWKVQSEFVIWMVFYDPSSMKEYDGIWIKQVEGYYQVLISLILDSGICRIRYFMRYIMFQFLLNKARIWTTASKHEARNLASEVKFVRRKFVWLEIYRKIDCE